MAPNQNKMMFSFSQVQEDGSVIYYDGVADSASLEVTDDYGRFGAVCDILDLSPTFATVVTARLHNPVGIYRREAKAGVVMTASVHVPSLTAHNISEARHTANVSSDVEFTVSETTDPNTLNVDGYNIKFFWTK